MDGSPSRTLLLVCAVRSDLAACAPTFPKTLQRHCLSGLEARCRQAGSHGRVFPLPVPSLCTTVTLDYLPGPITRLFLILAASPLCVKRAFPSAHCDSPAHYCFILLSYQLPLLDIMLHVSGLFIVCYSVLEGAVPELRDYIEKGVVHSQYSRNSS